MQRGTDYLRIKALLSFRALTIRSLAQRLDVSAVHLACVLRGERESARLWERIRAELGEEDWAFAVGKSNQLEAKSS